MNNSEYNLLRKEATKPDKDPLPTERGGLGLQVSGREPEMKALPKVDAAFEQRF